MSSKVSKVLQEQEIWNPEVTSTTRVPILLEIGLSFDGETDSEMDRRTHANIHLEMNAFISTCMMEMKLWFEKSMIEVLEKWCYK